MKASADTNRIARLLAALALALGAGGACEPPPAPAGPVYEAPEATSVASPRYTIIVHPLHNPAKLLETYQPLVDHLNQRTTDATFTLETSRDYQDYERKFRARGPAFILPNPWQTLEAMKVGYRVLAQAGDPEDFRGLILVRKDSGIRQATDLKGKTVSYPSPTALAACVMPQHWLHRNGVDVRRDLQNRYVGSQASSILSVVLGTSAAGATWPPPWRDFQREHPDQAATLTVLAETPPLVNNAFMVKDDIPNAVALRVRDALVTLHETPSGRAILAKMQTARFHPATNETYAPVRDYVARFEQDVRPVESP